MLVPLLTIPLCTPMPFALQRPLATLLLLFGAVSDSAAAQGAPGPVTGRSMVTTKLGIVASSSPLAAKAGTQILEMGGNAVDAAERRAEAALWNGAPEASPA